MRCLVIIFILICCYQKVVAQVLGEKIIKFDPLAYAFSFNESRITAHLEHNYGYNKSYQIGIGYMTPRTLNQLNNKTFGVVGRNGEKTSLASYLVDHGACIAKPTKNLMAYT
jgi:hypothetical protein